MSTDTFQALCQHFHAEPDRDGNVWITCPACHHGGRHCSFHPQAGVHCFRCDFKQTLRQFAQSVLGVETFVTPAPLAVKPPKLKAWQKQAKTLAFSFTQTPGRLEAWRAYKPLPAQLIDLYHFGYGVFPSLFFNDGSVSQYGEPIFVKDGTAWWQCSHRRLIIPLFSGGDVVGFRCRAVECDCPRWLSPGGSKLVLWGGAVLLPPDRRTNNLGFLLGDSGAEYAQGKRVVLTENPVDAVWAQHSWGVLAIATLGVSLWKPGWTKLLADAHPKSVLVLYDNDLAGNGGAEHRPQLEAQYRQAHGRPAPEPWGMKRARELRAAKVPTRLHDWTGAPLKADLAELLKAGGPPPSFTPQALNGRAAPPQAMVQPLTQYFITEFLGRTMDRSDYGGSHFAHAKQLLQHWSYDDIVACLKAVRWGLLDCPWELQYLSQLNKGEPSLLAQWQTLAREGVPVWKTDEYAKWKELTGRELPQDNQGDDCLPMWPPGMRPVPVAG